MIYLREYKEYICYQKITAPEFFMNQDADIKEYSGRISRWLSDNKGEYVFTLEFFNNLVIINFIKNSKNSSYFKISFYADKDEWFYVKIQDEITDVTIEYYKCDQLDGLFQLIKDKIL